MKKSRSNSLILGLSFLLYIIFVLSVDANAYYRKQSRAELISHSLDAWEAVEKRHYEAGQKKSFADVERRHKKDIMKDKKGAFSPIDKYDYRSGGTSNSMSRKHQFDARWGYSRYKYDEPDVMKQKGKMFGVEGKYTYRPDKDDLLYSKHLNTYKGEVSYRWADNLTYSARGEQAGLKLKPVKDYILELRGLLGREYVADKHNLLVYSGFGYRYLNDMDKPPYAILGNTMYLSYGREAMYYYLPVGFEDLARVDKDWEVTFKGEYDWFLYGQTISHGTDMNWSGYLSEDITHNQHKGFGLRGSLEFAKKSPIIDFVVEPFFEYWKIEGSDCSYALVLDEYQWMYEPPNFTVETGIKLGFKF